MAEFCLKCFNQLNETKYTEAELVLSGELDLCEGCGRMRRVVVGERKFRWLYRLIGSV